MQRKSQNVVVKNMDFVTRQPWVQAIDELHEFGESTNIFQPQLFYLLNVDITTTYLIKVRGQ